MPPAAPCPPEPLPQSACPELNLDQWTGLAVIAQVAKAQRELGDPYKFATATDGIAAVLEACFPDRPWRAAPSPEPPASSGAGQAAPPPAPPKSGPPADPK